MPAKQKFNPAAIKHRLRAAVEKTLQEEERHTRELLSVEVEYGFAGNVTVRSKPGEPPRKETGELSFNIDASAELHHDHIKGTLSVSRPSTPWVPQQLQNQMNRPIITESATNLASNGAARIIKHFNATKSK